MNGRYRTATLLLAGAIGGLVATYGTSQISTGAQQAGETWTQTRTPWGDPDLQGVWRYEGAIPLERPARFQGRDRLTDEEVAQIQKVEEEQAAQRLAGAEGAAVGRRSVGESPIRGNEYNSFWQDHGRPRQVSRQTSLIVEPGDGRIPYTADARKAEARSSARYGAGPYESFLDPDTGERCLTDGVTALMWQGPNGGHNRIVQSPGFVTILHEEYLDRRIIPVDGRAHRGIRQWFGSAVGKWEDRDLRGRHDELHRPDQLRVGHHLHAAVRVAAPGGALHANRREHHRVPHHGRGSGDVREALDGGDADHAAAGRHADLRIRLPRRQLRDDEPPGRRSRRRREETLIHEVIP